MGEGKQKKMAAVKADRFGDQMSSLIKQKEIHDELIM